MSLQELSLSGRPTVYLSTAAAMMARWGEVRKESIKESLSDFQGAGHRLEFVASIRGVRFLNDSKATNVNSTWYALENESAPVIWIAGGRDNGNNYEALIPTVQQKVKAIICLGINNQNLIGCMSPHCAIILETTRMEQAVQMAYRLGQKGDTVVLSPACASFDLFDNYEDRGNQFVKAVVNL
ncbi:MAG: hypothetical protein EOM83_05985 [Clostridia bacterium]|nr:hypothetical protein [Clostridia bacterium]